MSDLDDKRETLVAATKLIIDVGQAMGDPSSETAEKVVEGFWEPLLQMKTELERLRAEQEVKKVRDATGSTEAT